MVFLYWVFRDGKHIFRDFFEDNLSEILRG